MALQTTDTSAPATGAVRFWLRTDAAVTGINGAAYLFAAPVVEGLTGVPAGWLRGLGIFLVVFAVGVGALGFRERPTRLAVLVVVAVNGGWVAGSLAVAVVGGLDASSIGRIWILAQAAVVALLADQQARNLPA